MKLIPLSKGLFAKVDDEDYDFLMQWKWYAKNWGTNKRDLFYAEMTLYGAGDGSRQAVSMHRLILGLARGDKRQGDHINRETLDNQRHNLRIVTSSENNRNRTKRSGTASKYLGVLITKSDGKSYWTAQINHEGNRIYLGTHKTEEEAAKAYDAKATELFGQYANLNFK